MLLSDNTTSINYIFKSFFSNYNKNSSEKILGFEHQVDMKNNLNITMTNNELSLSYHQIITPDFIYIIEAKNKKKPPQSFDMSATYFHIINFYEENDPTDLYNNLLYLLGLFNTHYSDSEGNIYIIFTIIYGPDVTYTDNFQDNFGCCTFKPHRIFLSQTNTNQLLSDLNNKLNSRHKATRLELLKLCLLPKIEKITFKIIRDFSRFAKTYKLSDINEHNFDILKKCFNFGSNPALSDDSLSDDFLDYFCELYFPELREEDVDTIFNG
jgi:hypothetical protein